MQILVIGSGGREDALVWALGRSERVRHIACTPGNAGIARRRATECLAIDADDVEALAAHAQERRYDLVVIGPEAPLVAGLGDRLRAAGLAVFGPDAAAARIEGSKAFSKEFMARHRIPTARFRIFEDAGEARRYLAASERDYPLVVKADGLAAGKGVIIADNAAQAIETAEGMLRGDSFGDAGRRIVVEELLRGREASFFVLTDGEAVVELATCQDYKRASDDDRGPNTGGMGTYSPSPWLDPPMRREILQHVVRPTLAGLAAEGAPYRGVLYVGLMLTAEGPRVLEYNARFGDPETQVLMPRLDGDWADLLHACATGSLRGHEVSWKPEAAVCVVMTSGGYPGPYEKGAAIDGIENAESRPGVAVFHAGTTSDDAGRTVTSGGRVLGVTAVGSDVADARARAYAAVGDIAWAGEHHRSDIAADAAAAAPTRGDVAERGAGGGTAR